MEYHEDYIFLTLFMIYPDKDNNKFTLEHISLIFGKDFIISFQELEGDVFDSIRNKLKILNGRIRKNNSDYLCYCMIEEILNNYVKIIEELREKMECAQDYLITQSKKVIIEDLFFLKNDLTTLRKTINPLQEVIVNILKLESNLISPETNFYFKDLLVNIKSIIDQLDNLNDTLMGLFDLHLTNKSNELNEVMKVLTMFSVPFMPLSFLAGLYGMNFDYLPELRYHYSYPILIGVMISIFIGAFIFFKKKKWL
jgi:magnesium transporter